MPFVVQSWLVLTCKNEFETKTKTIKSFLQLSVIEWTQWKYSLFYVNLHEYYLEQTRPLSLISLFKVEFLFCFSKTYHFLLQLLKLLLQMANNEGLCEWICLLGL